MFPTTAGHVTSTPQRAGRRQCGCTEAKMAYERYRQGEGEDNAHERTNDCAHSERSHRPLSELIPRARGDDLYLHDLSLQGWAGVDADDFL